MRWRIKSFASGEISEPDGHPYSTRRIFSYNTALFLSQKGKHPVSNTYVMTPTDHRSQALSYGLHSRTSGATYSGEPQHVTRYSPWSNIFESPKSATRMSVSMLEVKLTKSERLLHYGIFASVLWYQLSIA